ncbi:hypothetical protein [Methylobacterium platani]|uniref:hypothetical protein n=1 Tax=Methylobacterium platani TaxID=427683 RepID=UPI000AD79BFD|nr:hypothetical protein [Methylobacterium platani]
MPDVRTEKTYDGRWTVFIGSQIVVADLDEQGADALVACYRKIVSSESGSNWSGSA